MNSQDNQKMGPWANVLATESARYNMSGVSIPVQAEMPPAVKGTMEYQVVYPEVYYKIQPYVIMMCDQMDVYGATMPSQQTVENISDKIYDDVCRMYPDVAEYAHEVESTVQIDRPGNPDGYGRGYRRRGFLRDFITILLLNEFFGRRRRFY